MSPEEARAEFMEALESAWSKVILALRSQSTGEIPDEIASGLHNAYRLGFADAISWVHKLNTGGSAQ